MRMTMKHAVAVTSIAVLVSTTATLAQGNRAAPEKPLVPLKVQVTLSRYEGEKKTSNLPFTLWVNANDSQRTELNVGSQVPIVTGSLVQGQGSSNVVPSIQYRNIGTTMVCSASVQDDGRFRVFLNVNDSSLAPSAKDATTGNPTFQSFSIENYLLLRDGQTAQFVAATDKITGEVTKVDVTITVLK